MDVSRTDAAGEGLVSLSRSVSRNESRRAARTQPPHRRLSPNAATAQPKPNQKPTRRAGQPREPPPNRPAPNPARADSPRKRQPSSCFHAEFVAVWAKREKGVDDAPKMRSEATIRREAAQTEGRAHERLCREVAARSRAGRLAHVTEQRGRYLGVAVEERNGQRPGDAPEPPIGWQAGGG